eukprot:TRINITY_DN1631_c0_g1_i1.p3 TRINITY_DN1631_c0_g1~~TRINITY_DN1631_c0_g1_i1.p3  ORF type:complete len:72 (-),score=6.98 TRINITY_DN1631_c0_g1_i1:467-682(-)
MAAVSSTQRHMSAFSTHKMMNENLNGVMNVRAQQPVSLRQILPNKETGADFCDWWQGGNGCNPNGQRKLVG